MEIRERLAVKEWHGSAEPLKSDEGLERRAELARATPRSNLKSEETKRRVFGVFVVLTTLVVFSAVPFTLYFLRKEGRKPSGDPSEDPHPHRHS